MSTAVAIRNGSDVMENVLIKGDLSKLTPEQRSSYYMEVCKSVGLNPLTKPFEYITLNNKLTLYALRTCTDQLRTIHKVSVVDLTETEREGIIIVTAKVTNGEGRTDMAKGAVTIGSLKGDALCNAIMKAETKAKRRATLSLCGLGWLDETEIETIPVNGAVATKILKKDIKKSFDQLKKDMEDHLQDVGELQAWGQENAEAISQLSPAFQDSLRSIYYDSLVQIRAENFGGNVAEALTTRADNSETENPAPHNANVLKAG